MFLFFFFAPNFFRCIFHIYSCSHSTHFWPRNCACFICWLLIGCAHADLVFNTRETNKLNTAIHLVHGKSTSSSIIQQKIDFFFISQKLDLLAARNVVFGAFTCWKWKKANGGESVTIFNSTVLQCTMFWALIYCVLVWFMCCLWSGPHKQ